MLYVASPDYSQLRSNYLKAKDAYLLAQKKPMRARRTCISITQSPSKIWNKPNRPKYKRAGIMASAAAALKVMGITDPDALVKAPPSFEVPVRAPISGEVVEQLVSAGQFIQPGTTQCFTISDMSTVWVLVNVYQNDLALCEGRRPGCDSYRRLSRHFSRTHLIHSRRRWIPIRERFRRASKPVIPARS